MHLNQRKTEMKPKKNNNEKIDFFKGNLLQTAHQEMNPWL